MKLSLKLLVAILQMVKCVFNKIILTFPPVLWAGGFSLGLDISIMYSRGF